MVNLPQMTTILSQLGSVLEKNIEGDVVELGCNVGTTSLFIRRVLDAYGSDKEFHVYDSFQGLPVISLNDISKTGRQYKQGDCLTSEKTLIDNFKSAGLALPKIHSGWFKDIPDDEYPNKVCFAFFDGDLYYSIMDSFEKIYHRISSQGVAVVHDYGWEILPGVKLACDHFLSDKAEQMWGINNVGFMEKL